MSNELELYMVNALTEALTRVADKVAIRLREKAPAAVRSHIKVSIVEHNAGDLSIEIEIDHPAAGDFEDGTGVYSDENPHEIVIQPIRAQALAFEWTTAPVDLQKTQPRYPLVFFKHAVVKGIKPTHFITETLEGLPAIIDEEMAAAFSES